MGFLQAVQRSAIQRLSSNRTNIAPVPKETNCKISKLTPTMEVQSNLVSFEIIMDTKIKPSTTGENATYQNLTGLLENILLDFLESDDSSYLTNVDHDMTHSARYWLDCNSKSGTVYAKLNLIFSYTNELKPELSKPKIKTLLMSYASGSFPNMTVVKKCI